MSLADTLDKLGLVEVLPFDPAQLDPGIRRTVLWLRSLGCHTTDSGDGKTKPPGVGILDFPHVVIDVEPGDLLDEVDRLTELVADLGLPEPHAWDQDTQDVPEGLIQVEGSYANGCAMIVVTGLHDAILPEGLGT